MYVYARVLHEHIMYIHVYECTCSRVLVGHIETLTLETFNNTNTYNSKDLQSHNCLGSSAQLGWWGHRSSKRCNLANKHRSLVLCTPPPIDHWSPMRAIVWWLFECLLPGLWWNLRLHNPTTTPTTTWTGWEQHKRVDKDTTTTNRNVHMEQLFMYNVPLMIFHRGPFTQVKPRRPSWNKQTEKKKQQTV